jgi:hypothetical protein
MASAICKRKMDHRPGWGHEVSIYVPDVFPTYNLAWQAAKDAYGSIMENGEKALVYFPGGEYTCLVTVDWG